VSETHPPDGGDEPNEPVGDKLDKAVRRHRQRRKYWQEVGERSLAENLALIGSVGWLVVIPILLGIYLGRWIDQWAHTGIFWTATFTLLGACVGSYLGWRRIQHERQPPAGGPPDSSDDAGQEA